MSNLRIAGKTYLDIEKMTESELNKIGLVCAQELTRLNSIKVSQHNVGMVQTQVQSVSRQTKLLEKLINNKKPKEAK